VGYVLIWAAFFQWSAAFRRLGKLISASVFLLYSFVMGGFFVVNQQGLVKNWGLQKIYWAQIEACLRQAKPKLIIVDNNDEELEGAAGQAEALFDWTTPYVPYVLEQSSIPPREWPLVQTTRLFGQAELSGDTLKLSSLFTWYLFPTKIEVSLDDILLVKPFKGALVRPPQSVNFGPLHLAPRRFCYVKPVDSSMR